MYNQRRITSFFTLCVIAAALSSATVYAQSTVNLPVYSTGFSPSGPVAGGSVDSSWTVTGGGEANGPTYDNASINNPGGATSAAGQSGDWILDTANSSWVSASPYGSNNEPGGIYTFTQSFSVPTNAILNTGIINFSATADNTISEVLLNGIQINGISTEIAGDTGPQNEIAYSHLYGPFSINSATEAPTGAAFQRGTNTLTFVTLNQSGTPSGVDVNVTLAQISVVPEPSPVIALLLGAAFLSCLSLMRGNRRFSINVL